MHVRVQATMPVTYFYDVIIQAVLEPVEHTSQCLGRTISHVTDVRCLLAEGVVEEYGVTKKVAGTQRAAGVVSDHRYCYGGKFCMHTTAALYGLHFATVPSTTDTAGYWVKPGETLSESLSTVVGMPIFQFLIDVDSLTATAAYLNPISIADCVATMKGVGAEDDPVYRRCYSLKW